MPLRRLYYFLAAFFLLVLSNGINAQDLIVKTNGDSIICAITRVDQSKINYTAKSENGFESFSMQLSEVDYFQYSYRKEGSKKIKGSSATVNGTSSTANQSSGASGFRLGFTVGPSYQLAAIEDGLDDLLEDYIRELKWGLSFSLDAQVFINKEFGIGFKFSSFLTDNSLDNIVITDAMGNVIGAGRISDDIRINFIGPSGTFRSVDRNGENAFFVTFFIGYMGYMNDAEVIDPITIEGSTVGLGFDLGYDIKVDKNLYLGLQLSIYGGSLSEIEVNDVNGRRIVEFEDTEDYIGLQRIDFGVGLRFGS